jgi:hypothetical protein
MLTDFLEVVPLQPHARKVRALHDGEVEVLEPLAVALGDPGGALQVGGVDFPVERDDRLVSLAPFLGHGWERVAALDPDHAERAAKLAGPAFHGDHLEHAQLARDRPNGERRLSAALGDPGHGLLDVGHPGPRRPTGGERDERGYETRRGDGVSRRMSVTPMVRTEWLHGWQSPCHASYAERVDEA